MYWTSLQTFWYRYRRIETYLPKQLQGIFQRMTGRRRPNRAQLNQIERLGSEIGLSRNEVVASLHATPSTMGAGITQKKAIYFVMMIAVVIIAWGLLYIWAVLDPETAPFKTYVPGTFYGTIRPKDFALAGYPSIH